MAKRSAGILLYRFTNGVPEVFITHPGGPFWKNKDAGAWSIPKGTFNDPEGPLEAAIREFEEETGKKITGDFTALSPVRQSNGKIIYPFALEADIDPAKIKSNTFSMEWPPKSGKITEFPEIDRGAWVDMETAKKKLNNAQAIIIEELEKKIRK